MLAMLVYAVLNGAFQIRPGEWNLFCGGDIMLNGVSPSVSVFKGISVPTEAIFYANLEIPLTNTSERTKRKTAADIAARNQYVLKAAPEHIKNLVSAGIDVVSLGNNHTMDGGVSGLKQTTSLLDSYHIQRCGAGVNWTDATKPTVVVAPDGTRVAFISYLSFLSLGGLRACTPATAKTAGVAALTLGGKSGPAELERLKKVVSRAKEKADMVVVALHWGIEKQPYPAPFQVSLGRLFVDAGADVVLGAHPHVLQPGELYKGKPIIYSLGNFVNPGGGQAAMYKLTFRKTEYLSAQILPTSYSGGRVTFSKRDSGEISRQESVLLTKYENPESNTLTNHAP
jgi:Bacterial capsule synthesis protein PGA_cap